MQIYSHITYVVLYFIFSSILRITQSPLKMNYSKTRKEIESRGIEKNDCIFGVNTQNPGAGALLCRGVY